MRSTSFLVLLVTTACGAPASSGLAADDSRAGGHLTGEEAVVPSRRSQVPKADAQAERLVFVRAGSVWTMGPDGGDPEQVSLRAADSPDSMPAVSPDGAALAYVSKRDGTSSIYSMSLEELIPEVLVEGPASYPSFSHDGKALYFLKGDLRERRDLYRLNLSTGAQELLLEGDDDQPELGGAVAVSPNGESLVIAADRRKHQGVGLWRFDLKTKSLARIGPASKNAWARDVSPSLSPDGLRIVFASNRHSNDSADAEDYDVYSIAVDGSGLSRLTEDKGRVAEPVFSLDGRRIYFASTRLREHGFEWEIYVMAAQGGIQKRLTRDAQPQNTSPRVWAQRPNP